MKAVALLAAAALALTGCRDGGGAGGTPSTGTLGNHVVNADPACDERGAVQEACLSLRAIASALIEQPAKDQWHPSRLQVLGMLAVYEADVEVEGDLDDAVRSFKRAWREHDFELVEETPNMLRFAGKETGKPPREGWDARLIFLLEPSPNGVRYRMKATLHRPVQQPPRH